MTNNKATALREAAERVNAPEPSTRLAWAKWEYRMRQFEALADPPTILALLAERERLRGALEDARGFLSVIPMARDRERLRATIDQALEATDDQ